MHRPETNSIRTLRLGIVILSMIATSCVSITDEHFFTCEFLCIERNSVVERAGKQFGNKCCLCANGDVIELDKNKESDYDLDWNRYEGL